jgi:hypothetical protein
MKRKEKLDRSQFCPDSCDSLYRGKCIMRLEDKYNGSQILFFEQGKLHRRYFRREDCQLRGKIND